MQAHAVVPSQGAAETTPAQSSPVQQAGPPTVHCCPEATQAPAWQDPVVDPEGTTQVSPEQQSELAVQAPLAGWQVTGAAQLPAVQTPEQQSADAVQEVPLALQAATPQWEPGPVASGTQPSGAQQAAAPVPPGVQGAPGATQLGVGAVQRSTSPASGRHRFPSQHWSLNWQTSPGAMQHPASPV